MGPAAGILYSLVVALSAIGSINASLFAGARQYIASAERSYIPRIFGSLHVDRTTQESIYYDVTLKAFPSFLVDAVKWFAGRTERLRLEKRVPVYPIVVSYLLGSVFIIVGTFDGLLVFGGMEFHPCNGKGLTDIRHARVFIRPLVGGGPLQTPKVTAE